MFNVTIQYLKSSNNDPELTTEPSTDTSKVLSGFITVMTRRGSCLYKVKNIFTFFFFLLLITGHLFNFNINLEFG